MARGMQASGMPDPSAMEAVAAPPLAAEGGVVGPGESAFSSFDRSPLAQNGDPDRAQAEPELQGYIDEANRSRIAGWLWNPRAPDQRIVVDLMDGDARLARTTANEYRADLREAGIGDGRHAFTIPLGNGALPSGHNVLRLRCAAGDGEMPGSPIVIEIAAAGSVASPFDPVIPAPADDTAPRRAGGSPLLAAPSPLEALRVTGPANRFGLQSNIDRAGWTGIQGWIWNPNKPDERIALELSDGDTVLATVLATEYREDLEAAGIGDGGHGFSITFNETLLPHARHVLHLRPVGTGADIPSFPLVLTRESAGLDGTVQFILGNVMAEAERATSTDALLPIIGAMVGFLDAALARYFQLTEEGSPTAADLLNPSELSTQVRTLVDSIRWNYPPISIDAERDPLVSVIIPVFNKFELTYNCVKSLAEHGAEIPFEIIVVDDCSRDETMFAGFAFGSGIRLIRSPENGGFIRSCNRGFAAARGEYAVFLNNDTQVKPRWLDELYETLRRDPTIGVVGSKLLFPDGSLQECGGIIWRLGDGWNWGRDQAADDPRFCYLRDADYVSGAALMIKAELFRELGGFDEHYLPMYYEDTDLCFRVRQRGHRIVVQPASEVIHFEGQSGGGTGAPGGGMKRFQAVNHRKFFERWKDVLASHRFNGELPELEAERNVRRRALFIDDSVPEPDKDAGSNAAFQHMLSLQRLGYKVTFIPGDNMARIEPYTTELQRHGIECLYHPYFFSVEDVFRKKPVPFDLVYLHRYSNASKYAGMIRQHFPKARVLYNVADLHFLRTERQAEIEDDAELRSKAEQLRRLELGAMSFVDCVIVHSDAEAELLRGIAPGFDVRVIPWTIEPRDDGATSRGGSGKSPAVAFIGGYRHPPNVDAAVWAVERLMPVLRGRVPGIELLLVGSHMPPEVSALAAKDVVPLGYVPSLDTVFERVRLTIAPLRFGAGLKGKVLESMAAGIPCVMTSIAAEGIALPPELRLLVADSPEMQAERTALLCGDDDAYRAAASSCRAFIAANYSRQRIDALIGDAAAGVPAAPAP